jgi:hypothetical protein
MPEPTESPTFLALNKLAKWRKFFASWQLGTRPDTSGEYKAVANMRELFIIMRAELNALTGLMIEKGVFTGDEFDAALGKEAKMLDADYERSYPGFSTSQDGLHMQMPEALSTMRGLGFPP